MLGLDACRLLRSKPTLCVRRAVFQLVHHRALSALSVFKLCERADDIVE